MRRSWLPMARVAMIIGRYLPGHRSGGPVVSVKKLMESEAQHEFRVFTRDRDFGDTSPYEGLVPSEWTSREECEIAYLAASPHDAIWALKQLHVWSPDVIYLNGLHSNFTLLTLTARRCRLLPPARLVIAPRGDSSAGARATKSTKKRIARPFIRLLVGRNVTWHVSSDLEKTDVKNWWGSHKAGTHRFVVAPSPASLPEAEPSLGGARACPTVVFASRIDSMKGLDRALRIMSLVETPCLFQVHGLISDGNYWETCQDLAAALPDHIAYTYMGSYAQSSSQVIYSNADVFLFPTRGENFSHAIADALSVGCPVFATAGATQWDHVLRNGGGSLIEDDQQTASNLDQLLSSSDTRRRLARLAALGAYREWFAQVQNSAAAEGSSLSHGLVQALIQD